MSDQEPIKLLRCTECGKISPSLGWMSAHVERHRGFYGLQLPWNIGEFDAITDHLEVIVARDYETYTKEEVQRIGARGDTVEVER